MNAPVAQSVERLPRKQRVACSIQAGGPTFDFTGITARQSLVLSAGGWQIGRGKQPPKGSLKRLVDRGLVVPRERAYMRTTITEYDVPTAVAAAWALHLADQEAARGHG